MDKFQVLTWNVFNRFILRNEKVAYQVNPGEVLILDHAHDHCPGCKNCGVSRHWSDRRRENHLVFDSSFDEEFLLHHLDEAWWKRKRPHFSFHEKTESINPIFDQNTVVLQDLPPPSFLFPSKLSEFQHLKNWSCRFHPCFLHLVFLLSWQTFYTPLGYIQD